MNDRFIYDLNLCDKDELRKLIKYYDIDIKEKMDEKVLHNAIVWYDEKQEAIDEIGICKKGWVFNYVIVNTAFMVLKKYK
jgi:hypothetical protein